MKISKQEDNHEHCYHAYHGPIHMVIPDGHTVQKCCKCGTTRAIHMDHAHDDRRLRQFADCSSYFAPMGRYLKWGGY